MALASNSSKVNYKGLENLGYISQCNLSYAYQQWLLLLKGMTEFLENHE